MRLAEMTRIQLAHRVARNHVNGHKSTARWCYFFCVVILLSITWDVFFSPDPWTWWQNLIYGLLAVLNVFFGEYERRKAQTCAHELNLQLIELAREEGIQTPQTV